MTVTDTVISGPFILAGLIALAAGLVSFASPCVVPLVPGYLSYLSGVVGGDVAAASPAGRVSVRVRSAVRWRVLGAAALFVLGFSVVFIAESALVLGVYTALIANQSLLTQISGGVAILMGFILALPAFQRREWRPGMSRVAPSGRLWGAPVLGAAFGTGWLACTSPALTGIIALASATEWNGNAWRGLVLVVLYCAGLGIPFLLLALGLGWAGTALGFLRRHARVIQLGGAALMVAIGVAMLTGLWGHLLAPLQGSVLLL